MVVGVIPPVEKRAQCELLTSSAIRFWIIDSVVVVDDDDDDDDDDDVEMMITPPFSFLTHSIRLWLS